MINYKIKIQTKKLIRGKQLWNYYFTFYLVFSHWMYFFFSSLMKLSNLFILSSVSQKFSLATCFAYEWYAQQQLFPCLLATGRLQTKLSLQPLLCFYSIFITSTKWAIPRIIRFPFLACKRNLSSKLISPPNKPLFWAIFFSPLLFFFSQQNMVYKVFLVYYF